MKILLVSDTPCKALWDYYQPGRLEGIDLIISCGDLKRQYLEFLVTMSGKPLLYVPGNHDTGYIREPPEGCSCIDGAVVRVGDLRIMGLGGCPNYNNEPFQYTEAQMSKRIRKMRRALKRSGGVDMVITHAAIKGHGDADDYAHRGFECFLDLVEKYHPKYFIHGHVHQSYNWNIPRQQQLGDTTIINAYERFVLEV